jgi:23S rRNA (guanosine2251-2'-O)-methyltransferase
MHEWLYGRNAINEVLSAGRRQVFRVRIAEGAQEKGHLAEIIHSCKLKNIPIERLPRPQLESNVKGNQGVTAEVSEYPYADIQDIFAVASDREEKPFILILDVIQDPQNLATLLRTAEAVGVHGVILPFKRAATITPAVVNASSGASEHLMIVQGNLAQMIETIKKYDIWVIGLDINPDSTPAENLKLEGAIALIVGSESEGMRHLVKQSCDMLMRIPMRGKIDSLNAAVAGSIGLFLIWRARSFQGWNG